MTINDIIATPGKAAYLLKSSSIIKRKRASPSIFDVDLNLIVNKRIRVQRLKRKPEEPKINAFLSRDENMQDVNQNSEIEEFKNRNEE